MLPLHQLRVKLVNAIRLDDAEQIKETVDEIFQAFGDCQICYGRGYLISNQTGKYCTCERAERLKEFVKNYND